MFARSTDPTPDPPARRRPATGWAGQATVEFALMTLVLLPMAIGTIEIGRGVWYYNQISQLSREGARWLIVTTYEDNPASPVRAWNQTGNAPALVNTYNAATCSCPNTAVGWIASRDVGIPTDQLTVKITRSTLGTFTWGVPITVEVSHPYQPIVTRLLNIPATINLRATTTMHMQ